MKKPQAPFPWFGGKSRVADLVWSRFGDVSNYVEPFAGSLAVMPGRSENHARKTETVNDLDGLVANFWRAVKHDPESVAHYADRPVNECDLHAIHLWCLERLQGLPERLMADIQYHDAQLAGWWVWGLCCWIGHGWCSGNGPWQNVDGVFSKGNRGQGAKRQLPHLGNRGRGVVGGLPHLDNGRGVNKQLPHLGRRQGVTRISPLVEWMKSLAARFERVRVCCGDWKRVCGPAPLFLRAKQPIGVFLDPPYDLKMRAELYREEGAQDVASGVREWAIEHGDIGHLRIALCGYEGEHEMPDEWECVQWKAIGGYGSRGKGRGKTNSHKERIWFSPACLGPVDTGLPLE